MRGEMLPLGEIWLPDVEIPKVGILKYHHRPVGPSIVDRKSESVCSIVPGPNSLSGIPVLMTGMKKLIDNVRANMLKPRNQSLSPSMLQV